MRRMMMQGIVAWAIAAALFFPIELQAQRGPQPTLSPGSIDTGATLTPAPGDPGNARQPSPGARPSLAAPAAPPATPTPPSGLPVPPSTEVQLLVDLNETVEHVTVTVLLFSGQPHTGSMVVTHFRPAGPGPFPAVVISHGRSGDMRHVPPRQRALGTVRYWTNRGFAVFAPTRLGYGDSGLMPDPERIGPCDEANFAQTARAAGAQIQAAVGFAQTKSWVDARRIILMGQSVGGLSTTAANGLRIPGVIAAINTAGGHGGRIKTHPGNPCSSDRLGQVFGAAGNPDNPPMLWLYSENDQFWGADLPVTWHQAYSRSGARAEYVRLPPHGQDGHFFLRRLSNWRPHVDRFLAGLGFSPPSTPNAPPASGFADLDDAQRVPHVDRAQLAEHYPRFLALDVPRAFVIGPGGQFQYSGASRDALQRALDRCWARRNVNCQPYAVDDNVVWRP